ncbi:Hypothetical protein, putative [Bodo saltans]|uniref:Uncharacterized protein n=1 Tax=Bodo saltans TaxID=75058 RepID=A0A0S4KHT3_BODSA|nr:Hypothetical protein, putative [Bodo saltans]|eukprot:CUI14095.1 Hypothetical protein, putative [Bodo saltans]
MLPRLQASWELVIATARKNPVTSAMLFTSAVCMYFEVRAARYNYKALHTTQTSVETMVDEAVTELRGIMKSADRRFGEAMNSRDDFTRQLQLQNVEQSKSVSRLQAALRMCVRDPRVLHDLTQFNGYYGGSTTSPQGFQSSSSVGDDDTSVND